MINRRLFIGVGSLFFVGLIFYIKINHYTISGAPPDGISESEVPTSLDPLSLLKDWQRPSGPPKVGIQVGHWQNQLAPEEQKNLRQNHGASAAGVNELDINLDIAHKLQTALEIHGYQVDLLPVTIPPGYWADVFISIHADGSTDTSKSGYKFAGPWRDFSKKSHQLVKLLEEEYASASGLVKDPNITRNMRGYYAFSWWRYDHAIHPLTTAVIAETGFVTHSSDRDLLTNESAKLAQALATAITKFIKYHIALT